MSPATKTNKTPALGNVGSKLRDLRKARNLTQSDLAARIGIQQSDLCRMENGQYRVNLETLVKILMEFRITFSEFFQEEVHGELTHEERALLSSYRGVEPESQAQIMRFVEFLRSDSRASSPVGPLGPETGEGTEPVAPARRFPRRDSSGVIRSPAEAPPPALPRRKPRQEAD
jgi:transcriptional regulator with XRE-family HTH domain